MASDLGEWALDTLKTVSAVTDLIVDGATGIVESGKLNAKDVEDAERWRLEDDVARGNLIIRLLVQDTGEYMFEGVRFARCSVFVLDRRKGYTNIRAVREQVLEALLQRPVTLPRNAFIVKLRSTGRGGHETMINYDLEFERVDLFGPIKAIEPDEYS